MDKQSTEKRRALRKREETLVRFEGENFSIYSRATDISDSGAFVATHYLLEPGTKIDLHLFDPAGKESSTPARVVRATTHTNERGETTIGLGIEFVDDDPNTVA